MIRHGLGGCLTHAYYPEPSGNICCTNRVESRGRRKVRVEQDNTVPKTKDTRECNKLSQVFKAKGRREPRVEQGNTVPKAKGTGDCSELPQVFESKGRRKPRVEKNVAALRIPDDAHFRKVPESTEADSVTEV
ncbi:hypothetical protein J6590_057759 [Homalodisca vitripennis]|nr:hypothetical protein J6590_057759 [Homalodisca vitripennis]